MAVAGHIECPKCQSEIKFLKHSMRCKCGMRIITKHHLKITTK
ncbi:hypothetical protein SAMN05428981_101808 [Bacillus sp. OV194]|nr:hypothetical protein SAMN05428981_101808 [Bacillus sp. OV194]